MDGASSLEVSRSCRAPIRDSSSVSIVERISLPPQRAEAHVADLQPSLCLTSSPSLSILCPCRRRQAFSECLWAVDADFDATPLLLSIQVFARRRARLRSGGNDGFGSRCTWSQANRPILSIPCFDRLSSEAKEYLR